MRFLLLYASQTGQSQAVAEEIFEKASEYGFQPELHNINQTEKKFNIEKESLLVLVISSTGDGEPPDTALKFWRRIRKKTLTSDHLVNLRYTILGLGDSNYSNFCQNPKNFDARFKQLGAQHFYPMGFADDAVGLEIVVEPWIEGLLTALKNEFSKNAESSQTHEGNATECECNHVQNATTELDKKTGENHPAEGDAARTVDKINKNAEQQEDFKLNEGTHKDNPQSVGIRIDNVQDEVNSMFNKMDIDKAIATDETDNAIGCQEEIKMVSSLLKSVPPIGQVVIPALPHPFLEITYCDGESINLESLSLQNGTSFPSSTTNVIMADLIHSTVLTRHDAVKTALDIQLQIQESEMNFEPGDSFGIVCQNNKDEVEKLIIRLEADNVADRICCLRLLEKTQKKNAAIPGFLPTRATIRHMLLTCCDIRTPIKKAFIRMLAEYTTNPVEQMRLYELCCREGASQYTEFIRNANLSILDILIAFPSCRPPIERMLEHLPRLLPRPYSISSSPLVSTSKFHFVFNIEEIPLDSGRHYSRKGVCTGWLSELALQKDGQQKPKIPIYGRKNLRFRLQEDRSVPMILIAAGTGIAPFIGFLQHREAETQARSDTVCAPIWMFFGCRHQERDYLYRSELQKYQQSGLLSNLLVSFSRESNESSPHYVQDNILLHSDEVCNLLINDHAVVYVCGDARGMSKDVNATFVNIISQHQAISIQEAESVIMNLRKDGRYLEDIWT